MASKRYLVTLPEIRRFITDAMVKVGTPGPHAFAMAELLSAADYRGHFSHGLNRLEMYLLDLINGTTDACATPLILKEKASVALVDGMNGLGPVVGNYCMDIAMIKAAETGVGWVTARGSNHYGIAGWYSTRASDRGFLGLSFTNTSPVVVPNRSKVAALGTNPLAFSAPARGDSFVLDMATTAVSLGKIEVSQRENKPIPEGWAKDTNGNITTSADAALIANCLMPLGGAEETSGYKGTGLSMMAEILCGVLAGANYGPFVPKWKDMSGAANLGQCFIALDPSAFEPCFEDRLAHLLACIRALDPVHPQKPVMVAGDPEKHSMAKADARGGVIYHESMIDSMLKLASEQCINPMKSCKL